MVQDTKGTESELRKIEVSLFFLFLGLPERKIIIHMIVKEGEPIIGI